MPKRQAERGSPVRQRVARIDADHPRRMSERRHRGEQRGLDVHAGTQQLDWLDARGVRRGDEILALADEKSLLLTLAPRLDQAPHELQLRIGRRGDHTSYLEVEPAAVIVGVSDELAPAPGPVDDAQTPVLFSDARIPRGDERKRHLDACVVERTAYADASRLADIAERGC